MSRHSDRTKKVNPWREIVTEKIDEVEYSYSVMVKTSRSGLYQNERIVMLNHESFLGYGDVPSAEQMPFRTGRRIPKLKSLVKLESIQKVNNCKQTLTVSFANETVRGQWELWCEDSQMAVDWAKLLLQCINDRKLRDFEKNNKRSGLRQKIFESLSDRKPDRKIHVDKLLDFGESERKEKTERIQMQQNNFNVNAEVSAPMQKLSENCENQSVDGLCGNFGYSNVHTDEQMQYEKDLLQKQLEESQKKCADLQQQLRRMKVKMQEQENLKNKEIESLKAKIREMQILDR